MTLKLDNDVLAIYKPPFRFDEHSGYIFDSKNEMVSDSYECGVTRIRGWGRIQNMPNAEFVQDEFGRHMAEALNQYYQAKQRPLGVKNPVQPVVMDGTVLRFKKNKAVEIMLHRLEQTGFDLNKLHVEFVRAGVSTDDIDQFNQLIGYSVSGAPLNDENIRDRAYADAKNKGWLD